MIVNKKTLVLGASSNPNRYSYIAVQKLRAAVHEVIGIGKEKGGRETQYSTGGKNKTPGHPL
jgi:predicted CoA-binding protein